MCRCSNVLTGTLICFFLSINTFAQEVIPPMDIPLYLSGNFGELRSNHFHSGIDFKTQGVEGIPVKSVKDGFISRISVSPYGYGRAIYVQHSDGLSSVYAHLSRFEPTIESAVRDSQYRKESFSVNLHFKENEFPVKQGEIIAFSGNTGSSGGPHLHFEMRDSDEPIDPLPYFQDKINDTKAPEIRSIRLYPRSGKGMVNHSTENQTLKVIKDASGKFTLTQPLYAWGHVGLGIKAYDRMDQTTNIYGVREIILNVDGIQFFHSGIDRFAFDQTRYLNSFTDWEDWRDNRSFHVKSFIDPGNRLNIYHSGFDGTIPVIEERAYRVEYQLKDLYGNTSILSFDLIGKKMEIPENHPEGILFRLTQNNFYKEKGIDLEIPIKNLYTDIYLQIDTFSAGSLYSPLYRIGEKQPLHSYCPLVLDITQDTYPDKSKYGIVSVFNKKETWLGGKYEEGKMVGQIRESGDFYIQIDRTPPVILPLQMNKWTTNKKITFKITDNLSGISDWKGTLNDEFVLFEYDAKTNRLFCRYDPQRMKRGKQLLKLHVTDSAGNETEFTKMVVF